MIVETKKKKILRGQVVSDKMDKTIVVKFARDYTHPLVGKVMRTSKKYKVHDEQQEARVGDWVEFCESRPLSKTKYMSLVRVIESNKPS